MALYLLSLSFYFIDFRKDIEIEGRNGAVIRDVLIFTSTNIEYPSETDETLWTLRARVYLDLNSMADVGFLSFQRLDGTFSVRVAVSFENEAQVSGVYRDITLEIPVRHCSSKSDCKANKLLLLNV